MPKLRRLEPRLKYADLGIGSPMPAPAPTVERLRGEGLQVRNARVLRNEPLCRPCAARGLVTPAVEVDHVVPLHLGGADHESNLQPICDECHKAKTAAEASARAVRRGGGSF